MKAMFRRFVREDAGQDLLEYGLLIGIITLADRGRSRRIGPRVALYFTRPVNDHRPSDA